MHGFRREHAKPLVRPGAARALTLQALHRSRAARRELLVVVPLLVGVVVVNSHRREWFAADVQNWVKLGCAAAIGLLGYRLARDLGRGTTPWLTRRLDPATAGTTVFLIRLAFLIITLLVVAHVAGVNGRTIAVGGALFAVVFGLAAQQTLGNVIAGLVLISAQPFRVGDRVRLQAGGLAGVLEGVVVSHGLLYTTFAQGEDSIMVPNNIVLTAAVVPLREPSGVDLRARLRPDVKPSDVQTVIDAAVRTPIRGEPRIALEEIDADEVVVRITATPEAEADGARLADEILAAITALAQEGFTEEREVARGGGTRLERAVDHGRDPAPGPGDRSGRSSGSRADHPARDRGAGADHPAGGDAAGAGEGAGRADREADRATAVGRVGADGAVDATRDADGSRRG
jgi:small conductance mechanosensitive channel